MASDYQSLKIYVDSLQSQLASYKFESQTLNRGYEALQNDYRKLEEYYERKLMREHENIGQALQSKDNTIFEFQAILQRKDRQFEDAFRKIQEQQHQIQELESELESKYRENTGLEQFAKDLQSQIMELQSQDLNSIMERNLQEVISNYDKIERVVLEKEKEIESWKVYADQMEMEIQRLQNQLNKISAESHQLKVLNHQKQAMIEQREELISQLQEFINRVPSKVQSENPKILQSFLPEESSMSLVLHNNSLVEQIITLEKENMNLINRSQSDRFFNRSESDRSSSSPQKLKKRIQRLKQQNQLMMKRLVL